MTFLFPVWLIHAELCDREVRCDKGISRILDEGEVLFRIALKVVEEDAANPAHFTAMFQCEVFIAPFLESWVELRIVSITCLLDRPVKMRRIVGVRVARREIRSSAKPRGVTFFKIPKVGMDGGNHRTSRMKYERDSCREEWGAAPYRDLGCKLLRQVSVNRREIDARFLENVAFFEDPRSAPAAALACPCVFAESPAIEIFDRASDAMLQFPEIRLRPLTPTHIL